MLGRATLPRWLPASLGHQIQLYLPGRGIHKDSKSARPATATPCMGPIPVHQLAVPRCPHTMLVCPVSRGELGPPFGPGRVPLQAGICEMVGEGEGAWG